MAFSFDFIFCVLSKGKTEVDDADFADTYPREDILEAGCLISSFYKVTDFEREMLPEFIKTNKRFYVMVRNHILSKWFGAAGGGGKRFMSREQCREGRQVKFHESIDRVYDFLNQYGYINYGCLEAHTPLPTAGGKKKNHLPLKVFSRSSTSCCKNQIFRIPISDWSFVWCWQQYSV